MTDKLVAPTIWIKNVRFTGGYLLTLNGGDIVVIVGPNNSGKSAALRGLRDKLTSASNNSPVIAEVTTGRSGTSLQLKAWLASIATIVNSGTINEVYQSYNVGIHQSAIPQWWESPTELQQLARFFVHLLDAESRLNIAKPATQIAYQSAAPSHPIHFLYRDTALAKRVNVQFRKAFGVDLIVNYGAGSVVPLHVGQAPQLGPDHDRFDSDYIRRLESLPTIQEQGDGIRSFAGVLLETMVGRLSIVLLDEPEAFLHPPQARLLGTMLVREKRADAQLIVATHSGDVLRGILDANSTAVRIVRIRRINGVNDVVQLDATRIAALWGDPLLRFSNILDGVFHERVVVCEADSDSRFYSAVADVLSEAAGPDARKPDVMFAQAGGKQRMPMIVRALREVKVPVVAVVDFDALNAEHPLKDLVEACDGDWTTLEPLWSQVNNAIQSKRPALESTNAKAEIATVLNSVTDQYMPDKARDDIAGILKRTSAWAQAKSVGRSFIPSGAAVKAFDTLDAALRALGIFVVRVGEVEGFVRTVAKHGPQWVNDVLKKDLLKDTELDEAKSFVRDLLGAYE